MYADWSGAQGSEGVLRVDGGMSASMRAVPFGYLRRAVDRPHVLETTALGAAWLAGQRAGLYGLEGFAKVGRWSIALRPPWTRHPDRAMRPETGRCAAQSA